MYHKFCSCGGSILTMEQMATDQLCQRCRDEQVAEMKKHAETFKDRFETLQKEEQ